jgi:hypothetical protein
MSDLTEDQEKAAIHMWQDGECFGDIAYELGVGMYALSFLTRPPYSNWQDTNPTPAQEPSHD